MLKQCLLNETASNFMLLMISLVCLIFPVKGQEQKLQVQADHISYLDNGTIRIGVNLDLGGAITYLSTSNSQVNLINSFDWGRQIQMSHYSGPVPFAPNGKQPTPTWAGLGWNPIQSGDCYGNRSKVLEHRNDGKELYTQCVPMQWPLNNEPGECTFECWIQLKGNTALVRSRLNNNRSDKTQYPARDQELPAIYTNAPWYRLMTYTGDKPFKGDALTTMPPAFPWVGWQGTENWAALVNEQNQGIGIWEPDTFSFIGGFTGKPGTGGPKDAPTGYIAPIRQEILDYNIPYEYDYVLIVGSLDEIRHTVYQIAPKNGLPDYHFIQDRQHWHYVNATDTGWPIQGELKVLLPKDDPQLIGPTNFWQAVAAPILYIEAAFQTGQTTAQIFWCGHGDASFTEAKSVSFEIKPDGQYHRYEVNLAASPQYQGSIIQLRFDPVFSGKAGDFVRIKSISFIKPKDVQ
ncbi:MAG: hypothetical protein JOZ57_04575 [Abitibacteriaceae bacterium]|nr:hypothetical protein [Abditibacteriaceae bacterium]